ncbi:DUF397 domain-containing protein [Sphaerisporangium sp. TRM90804]|uniref:DUF397 domain-containing protein n=1 Tax=Sphaerisporangium sp. TRM90804 TaxID=3031113 RepID=UPI00244819AB|nr:DUF397 domain-containing protein [Sphaerisporangium sp. TRM90804]MDH2427064.1 DUF397 domain-containing protein [Sphaerisporangium sp. TRM90804]
MDLSNATWRKSSYTGSNGGNCVEVAELPRAAEAPDPVAEFVAVRDSKNPEGPKLFFTPDEWGAFLRGVKGDAFDREAR